MSTILLVCNEPCFISDFILASILAITLSCGDGDACCLISLSFIGVRDSIGDIGDVVTDGDGACDDVINDDDEKDLGLLNVIDGGGNGVVKLFSFVFSFCIFCNLFVLAFS